MIPQLNIFMFLPTLQLAQLYDSHINSFNSYSVTITHLELYEALEVEVGVKQKEPEYIADPTKCQSGVLTLNALGVGRREGSWAAKATSDLIIQYLGYHIFLCLENRLSTIPLRCTH